ncbi:adipokinetic hormone/corazonin-related peptide receptor variant I-like isoform X2 [Ischnura elegans]|uniref:adipokinetic hormone/corazonin-related peptide receptor variant I-like isoform X2 n=1 Tax=Ischnura elegans TaxID=197161 RepID=UPI001ED88801|nr:adipokinetic hormone/corazonin-related peptide receptor variant I-like isoform X2 [Ischnura elegans]
MLVPATMFPAAHSLLTAENGSLAWDMHSTTTEVADPIIVAGPLPPPAPTRSVDMVFNEGHRLAIIVYSLLMVVSTIGNTAVLVTILRRSKGKRLSRVNLMLFNLAIADLLVTFLLMPLEIGWSYTVKWEAGDTLCRLFSFFRTFGLFLSGFVLMCISVDRLFAVTRPLNSVGKADQMGRKMLIVAWVMSAVCSAPQAIVFHVEVHPDFEDFTQCVTFHSFPSRELELTYSICGSAGFYIIPLIVISFCYTSIFNELSKKSAETEQHQMRRSSSGNICRAKIRTLQMTFVTVIVFFVCWTPYNVMSFWYWFDDTSAKEVDQKIQRVFFVFACTNSAVNPMVYGFFNFSRQSKRKPPVNGKVTHQTPSIPRESNASEFATRGRLSTCTSISSASSVRAALSSRRSTKIVEEPETEDRADPTMEQGATEAVATVPTPAIKQ